ncbi:MAG: hypothetical protein ABFD89_29320 [Bryobacteraceae bacterium]
MADEVTVTGLLAFEKSPSAKISVGLSAGKFSVTGTKYVHGVQNVGTAAEAIGLGDLGTPGWFYLKNLDTANYVEILSATGGAVLLKIKAGEIAVGRFGAAAPAAQANTAAVNIEYLIVED